MQANRESMHNGTVLFIYLSFGEAELLCDLPPLRGAQVLVLAEGIFQSADLFRGELGPHPSVETGFTLAVVSLLTLRARRISTTVCDGEKGGKKH